MVQREKHTTLVCDEDVRIDIRQIMDGRKVKGFAINVAVITENGLKDVFRVDTAHGHLHQQRFWISDKPEKIQDKGKKNYVGDFGYWKNTLKKEYRNYVEQYKKTVKSGTVKR